MTDEIGNEPRGQVLRLFSVPFAIVEDAIDASANASLIACVLADRREDPGLQRANAGGWHSRPDLPARGVPAFDDLFGTLLEHVRNVHMRICGPESVHPDALRFAVQAWATVMEQGHYAHLHDHADAHWSAVYYADAGDSHDPASGRIHFLNPAGAHRALPGAEPGPTRFQVTPQTGCLLIFPGWLQHGVDPYLGSRPRIAISANLEVRTD